MDDDRLPPHSIEAERGVLGCILMEPATSKACILECMGKFSGGAEVFYELRHRLIYSTAVDLFLSGVSVDIILIKQKLADKKQLEECGGLAYLSSLPDAAPSAASIGHYISIVVEKFVLRRAIGTCTDIIGRSYDFTNDVDALMDGIEGDLIELSKLRTSETNTPKSAKELVISTQERIVSLQQSRGSISGIATGFVDFDAMTGGLQPGEMFVLAARPSVGKSSLAINMADHVAVNLKIPVVVISLEMSAESLMMRMVCSRARVSLGHVKHGSCTNQDIASLAKASTSIASSPIYIDDRCGGKLADVQSRCRRAVQNYHAKVIIVDYMGLMSASSRSKEEEVATISKGLKFTARDLGVSMIAISQLNREVEHRNGGRPRLSDLRGSGAIEQDADVVGLLHRPDETSQEWQPSQLTTLIIAKQRNGDVGDIPLVFFRPYTRFETAAVHTEPPPPQIIRMPDQ